MQQKLKKTVRVAKAPGSSGPRRGRQAAPTAALARKSAVAVKGRRATLLKKVSKAGLPMVETASSDPDQNSNASSTSSSEQAIKDLLDEVNQV